MQKKLKPLKEQVVIITAASGVLGLVTAGMAAGSGARLVLAGHSEEALAELTDSIMRKGGTAMYVVADVRKEQDIRRIAQSAVRTYGTFDTWVNNAGVSVPGGCLEMPVEEMRSMFDTNFWGTVYGSRIAIEHYINRGLYGSVVTVGSFPADGTDTFQSLYSLTKKTTEGWLEALRIEIEKQKIPVSLSLIQPRRIDTPYLDRARNFTKGKNARRTYGYAPEAVADAILACAVKPEQDLYVGLQSRLLSVPDGISPGVAHPGRFVVPNAEGTGLIKRQESPVPEPTADMLKERRQRGSWFKSNSVYTEASKRPIFSTLMLAGLGAGMWLLTKRKKKMHSP